MRNEEWGHDEDVEDEHEDETRRMRNAEHNEIYTCIHTWLAASRVAVHAGHLNICMFFARHV